MRQFIEETIGMLKNQVKDNLYRIEQNQLKIREIFEQPAGEEQKHALYMLYDEMTRLLTENNDYINMQMVLVSFFEKNKKLSVPDDVAGLSADPEFELPTEESVIYDMTTSGELPFDQFHPMFHDEKFFKKLLHYYQSIEAYEKCAELMMAKNLVTER